MVECGRENRRLYRQRHPEKARASEKASKAKHKDRVKKNWIDWCEKNKERLAAKRKENLAYEAAKSARWRANNPEKCREVRRNSRNRTGHRAAYKKQFAKTQATPTWVDIKAIQAFYIQARQLTKETGTKYHVDYIVPLQGKTVCGLHVPWNLQILTAEENIRKGNRLNP